MSSSLRIIQGHNPSTSEMKMLYGNGIVNVVFAISGISFWSRASSTINDQSPTEQGPNCNPKHLMISWKLYVKLGIEICWEITVLYVFGISSTNIHENDASTDPPKIHASDLHLQKFSRSSRTFFFNKSFGTCGVAEHTRVAQTSFSMV